MSNNKCNLPRSTRGSVNSAKCSCSVAGCGSGMVGVLLWPLSDSPLQHTPGLAACQDSLPPQLSTPLRAFALAKKLIKTLWQSHSGTTFQVYLLSTLLHRPAFLPRPRRGSNFPPSLGQPSRPPVYDAFSPEDRALFIDCKQRLGPARLNELTEVAVEWLTERCKGDPEVFSDALLRDKVDELVFYEVFGPERRKPYEQLFTHLHSSHSAADQVAESFL